MPKAPEAPTIKETTAPEPEAPIFGGTDAKNDEKAGDTKPKKGVSGLKIQLDPPKADSTGANRGLNTRRG